MHLYTLHIFTFTQYYIHTHALLYTGDHIALLRVYNDWVETNYSTQWCYENYIQVSRCMQYMIYAGV